MNTQQLTLEIKDLATEKGADIVGVVCWPVHTEDR